MYTYLCIKFKKFKNGLQVPACQKILPVKKFLTKTFDKKVDKNFTEHSLV